MNECLPDFVRRSTVIDLGSTDRRLRRAVSEGDLVRVVPGTFVSRDAWVQADGMGQHRLRVLATAERIGADVVFSHRAAAAIWGIRMLSPWPDTVDVTVEPASGGRSSGRIRRHCRDLAGVEVVEHQGMLVTSPAQTVVDLARKLRFADAVACIDSALHRRRKGGRLTMRGEVLERVSVAEGARGWRRARVAAGFSTDRSDSVEESHSRVQIHLLGFPPPVLQLPFSDHEGQIGEVDFAWPEFAHVGEFDGASKYLDESLREGRTVEQVVLEEKRRENRIRRQVRAFSRWEARDLYPSTRMHRILSEAGLPSGRPRRLT
ncbi:hypothetical protein [Salinibacterium sp. GXW1014]|uniref:type IV toxin-antitoxin system AbiEi family antitoxin domain-containing protein n=1 Tax=Salinibacterium sp. GXW1014 TaxID=3377838 RepID=UPI00383A106F